MTNFIFSSRSLFFDDINQFLQPTDGSFLKAVPLTAAPIPLLRLFRCVLNN
jgi:hypothetical protein